MDVEARGATHMPKRPKDPIPSPVRPTNDHTIGIRVGIAGAYPFSFR